MYHTFPLFVTFQEYVPFSTESFRFILINVLWAFQIKPIALVITF